MRLAVILLALALPGAARAEDGLFGIGELTEAERRGVAGQVRRCWNLGSASSEALHTVVTAGFTMDVFGRPDPASIRPVRSEGGSEASADIAFQLARRAILRCAGEGYDLPVAKYAQWREVQLTFDPERMRMR